MKKKAYMYINYDNVVVLKTYLDVIGKALKRCGYEYEYVDDLINVDKKDLVIFPVTKDALKFYLKGYRNFIQWQQGIAGEESFMRHKSNLRKHILHKIDKFVMNKAKAVFFVSNFMKDYCERLLNTDYSDKAFVMPCYNETLDVQCFAQKNYDLQTFSYVGSLAEWQCFEKTISIYKKIEEQCQHTKLLVLTFEKEKAEAILSGMNIRNYIVKTVDKEDVKKELSDVVYGFLIRDDIIVNRVATPTKLSSYLASGVLPIFSSCLVDFVTVSKQYDVGFCLEDNNKLDDLIKFIKQKKDEQKIKNSIEAIFSSYYNENFYIEKIYSFLKERLKY